MTTERSAEKNDKGHDAHLSHPALPASPGKLGGARAEFVASLGKKIKEARAILGSLQKGQEKPAPRTGKPGPSVDKEPATKDDLRRRLHALGASAKLLRFESMANAIAEAAAILDRAPGALTINDVGAIASALDDLPAMAWGDPAIRNEIPRTPAPVALPEPTVLVRSALVVGSAILAEALLDPEIALPFTCERTDDAQQAMTIARADAPDVIVLDADLADVEELVEALVDDALTEAVPLIVVGSKQASRLTALGVAKTLAKPITAEQLRHACHDAIEQRNEVTMRVTLGEPTLEQLGERLADEVRRAIVESAGDARDVRVPLGEGTEVMSAVWGAIARVREVVTARTGGAVRFASGGPEGAIAVAPWLHPDVPGTDRSLTSVGRGRGPAADVRLHGRRVVVADDDPGVTWFIADLLRTAGCVVHEALDGTTALELAYRTSPEIVISDILMPGLDGFALTRALKRDVALRDVPVILLSWKEDLLQRVRELGASAAAYLRKESDSRAIVARVRECLRPRARVEVRLRGEGEVRGRLDGLTTRSLLELACAIRPDSRVSVRDASFHYEVELRDGAPRRATRTGNGGSFSRGEPAIAALLGVGAGRFTLVSTNAPVAPQDRDFSGSLAQQLTKPLSIARAARAVTTGARTITVDRVRLDKDALGSLFGSTPEPARTLIRALADGASPRQMLLDGSIDPALLDGVLGDLASRGVIDGVWDSAGEEVLASAVSEQLAPREATAVPTRSRYEAAPRMSERPPVVAPVPTLSTPRTPQPPPAPTPQDDDLVAGSLADAVMREISDRAPEIRTRSSNPPPIVSPGDLRPRSSNPPAESHLESQMQMIGTPIPPDAIVPADDLTEVDAPVEPSDHADAARAAHAEKEVSIPIDVTASHSAPVAPKSSPVDLGPPSRTPLSAVSSRVAPTEPMTPSPTRWGWLVGLGAVATAVAIALQMASGPANPAAAADVAPILTASAEPESTTPQNVTYVDIPNGSSVAAGQGMIEVHTRGGLTVRIDGMVRGDMPAIRVALDAGPHEVQIAARGTNDAAVVRQIEVRAGRSTRIDLPSL